MSNCFKKSNSRNPAAPVIWLVAATTLTLASCDSEKPALSSSKQSATELLNQDSAGGPSFTKAGADTWRLTAKPVGKPAYWSAVYSVTATKGREFVGKINLSASSPVRLTLSMMRAGSTPKEGSDVKVDLVPGQAKGFEVKHRFTQDHPRVKLQLAVVDGAPNTVLTIKDLSVREAAKGTN